MMLPFYLNASEWSLIRRALALLAMFSLVMTAFGWTAMRITRSRQPVIVPKVIGMEEKAAEKALRSKGLVMKVLRSQVDDRIPEGSVVVQTPRANNYLKRRQVVEVVLSKGKPRLPVPNVVFQTFRRAQNLLAQSQLRVGRQTTLSSGTFPKEMILAQVPQPGEAADASRVVDLLVSTGPIDPVYVMPDLKRDPLEKAFQLFRPATIVVEKIKTEVQDDIPSGTILDQSPKAGARIEAKSSVSFTVSTTSQDASIQPRLASFTYVMPEGPPRRLRIDVFDSTGTRTLYNKMEEEGNEVKVEVQVKGKASAQVYLNQQFDREFPIE